MRGESILWTGRNDKGTMKRELGTSSWKRGLRAAGLALGLAAASVLSADPRTPPPTEAAQAQVDVAPTALAASPGGEVLYVACAAASQVAVFDTTEGKVVRKIGVPGLPSGLALSPDGLILYATCSAPQSTLCIIDTRQGKVVRSIPTGHSSTAPVISPDGRMLYVCNRFDHDVAVIDLAEARVVERIMVRREPVAAALTPDGKLLLVANHLHAARADEGSVGASVSVVDTATRRSVKEIKLPRGSGMLRGIAVSPDGRLAVVTHLLARYYLPTTDILFGRINSNVLSLLDLEQLEWRYIVPLDLSGRGAANPWAASWTPDGKQIVVSHAGAHEISLVEAPRLPQKPVRVRHYIPLPGNGPRSLAFAKGNLYVANYFSDTLVSVDLDDPEMIVTSYALAAVREPSTVRLGERLFNDGTLCLQGWQSCASCHDTDARMDAMNWDLLNDGVGNPKNAKSLLLAHQTPPSMWLGARENAEMAVRAGLRHILFTEQPDSVAQAIDEYLKSLRPVPSPNLTAGKLNPRAERGRGVFQSEKTGCSGCHSPPHFTDQGRHDVGTRGKYDQAQDQFDTPTLIELWRTAPYLHDGSAATVRDVITRRNPRDEHGGTSHLTAREIEDLTEYLLSL